MTRGCFQRFLFPSIFKLRVRFKSVAMLSKLWMSFLKLPLWREKKLGKQFLEDDFEAGDGRSRTDMRLDDRRRGFPPDAAVEVD
jgi:hypothetical protein